jgi:hypothetical protein
MDYITKSQNIQRLLSVALDAYRAGDYRNGERYLQEYANSLLGNVQDVQALALSIHEQIGEAIEQARTKSETKQEVIS